MFPPAILLNKIKKIIQLSDEVNEINNNDKKSSVGPKLYTLDDLNKIHSNNENLKKSGIETTQIRLITHLESLSEAEITEIVFLYYVGIGQPYNNETYQDVINHSKEYNIQYLTNKRILSKSLRQGLILHKKIINSKN